MEVLSSAKRQGLWAVIPKPESTVNWIARLPIASFPKVMPSTVSSSPMSRTLFKQAIGHAGDACGQSIKNGNPAQREMESIHGNNPRSSNP